MLDRVLVTRCINYCKWFSLPLIFVMTGKKNQTRKNIRFIYTMYRSSEIQIFRFEYIIWIYFPHVTCLKNIREYFVPDICQQTFQPFKHIIHDKSNQIWTLSQTHMYKPINSHTHVYTSRATPDVWEPSHVTFPASALRQSFRTRNNIITTFTCASCKDEWGWAI